MSLTASRLLTRTEDFLGLFAKLGFLFLMMGITANVVGRYILGTPLPDAINYTELYFMPMAIFLYLSVLERKDGNVRVDLVRDRLNGFTTDLIDMLALLAVVMIFVPVLRRAVGSGIEAWEVGATVGITQLPTYPSWIILILGFGLLSLRLLLQVLVLIGRIADEIKRMVRASRV